MESKKVETLKQLQNMEEFYVMFSKATNNPYIICDPETFNDQIWIFERNEDLEKEAQPFLDQKNPVVSIKVENKSYLHFYSTLFAIGVNEVIFHKAEEKVSLELDDIVTKTDFSKLPEKERPLFNPTLQLSSIYFMQEFRRMVDMKEKESLPELEEEMAANLVRSKFLVPVEPQEDKERNVQVPYIKNQEGDVFQPVFTDAAEFAKFNGENKYRGIILEFKNLQKITIPLAKGFVVNPQGINLVVVEQQFEQLSARFGLNEETKPEETEEEKKESEV